MYFYKEISITIYNRDNFNLIIPSNLKKCSILSFYFCWNWKSDIKHFCQGWTIYCTVDNRTECPISISQSQSRNCFTLLRNPLQMSSYIQKHWSIESLLKGLSSLAQINFLPWFWVYREWKDTGKKRTELIQLICVHLCVCRGMHSWPHHEMHAYWGHTVTFRVQYSPSAM